MANTDKNTLYVSPSPHVKDSNSVSKVMYNVIIAMVPALLASFYFFGIESFYVSAVAIGSCVLFEFLLQKFVLKQKVTIKDGSAIITGLLLAFNLPSAYPLALVVIGSLVAIAIGKMTFGGLGNNPFNPALVGRVFLLVSFPVQTTTWTPNVMEGIDALSGATPLGILKEAFKAGNVAEIADKLPSITNLFVGGIAGSLGEVSALLLLLGGVYMMIRKVISWHIPVAVLASMFIFAEICFALDKTLFVNPFFHIVSGGAILGAFFMATDMVTSPMSKKGMIVFGVGIGLLTMIIRVFGAYPEGMSFAILIMNAFVPIINTYMKPKRFGAKK